MPPYQFKLLALDLSMGTQKAGFCTKTFNLDYTNPDFITTRCSYIINSKKILDI